MRFGSDLEIRIQRKYVYRHNNFLFCFAKPTNTAVYNLPLIVEPALLFLASRLKVITSYFLVNPASTTDFICAMRFKPPSSASEVCDIAHKMGRDPNRGCDFAKGQKLGSAEAITNLKLSCNFSNLSVPVCSVA